MKHFYCDLCVQHLNLHKNWHISFLLVTKSEILCISVIKEAKRMEYDTHILNANNVIESSWKLINKELGMNH